MRPVLQQAGIFIISVYINAYSHTHTPVHSPPLSHLHTLRANSSSTAIPLHFCPTVIHQILSGPKVRCTRSLRATAIAVVVLPTPPIPRSPNNPRLPRVPVTHCVWIERGLLWERLLVSYCDASHIILRYAHEHTRRGLHNLPTNCHNRVLGTTQRITQHKIFFINTNHPHE